MQSRELIAGSSEEKARQAIVNLVFLIYWFMIFEGALRKWIFPSLEVPLYFIKDPVILIAYMVAFKYGLWPKRNPLFIAGLSLGLTYFLLAAIQIIGLSIHPLVALFGWRNFFWFLPLAFLIGETFRGKDLTRLLRETLLMSIPIAGLVYVQFNSPPDAWINTYLVESQIAVVGSAVRPCGTFSYLTGQTLFVASTLPMLICLWAIPGKERPVRLVTLLLASAAVLINFGLNGSRAILVYASFALLGGALCSLILLRTGRLMQVASTLVSITSLVISAIAVMVMFFPSALEAQTQRVVQGESSNDDSVIQRSANSITTVGAAVHRVPALGHGLGIGSGGGAAILSGERAMSLSEHEWPRVVEESGYLGVLYLLYRVTFAVCLLVQAVQATGRSSNPLPVLLWSFTGVLLINGQLTIGGIIPCFAWMFAGFCLAANRLAQPTTVLERVELR